MGWKGCATESSGLVALQVVVGHRPERDPEQNSGSERRAEDRCDSRGEESPVLP